MFLHLKIKWYFAYYLMFLKVGIFSDAHFSSRISGFSAAILLSHLLLRVEKEKGIFFTYKKGRAHFILLMKRQGSMPFKKSKTWTLAIKTTIRTAVATLITYLACVEVIEHNSNARKHSIKEKGNLKIIDIYPNSNQRRNEMLSIWHRFCLFYILLTSKLEPGFFCFISHFVIFMFKILVNAFVM